MSRRAGERALSQSRQWLQVMDAFACLKFEIGFLLNYSHSGVSYFAQSRSLANRIRGHRRPGAGD
jgi:hypothetical protein